MTEYVYFKKNVGFHVGVRFHLRDNEGMVLTGANPYVNVEKDKLRDFLQANRYSIEKGLIVQAEEPVFDIVNENAITDEQATEMVKNVFLLKKKLKGISSESTLYKLYEEAKAQNRAKSVLKLIEDRLMETTPAGMMGVDWDTQGGDNDE